LLNMASKKIKLDHKISDDEVIKINDGSATILSFAKINIGLKIVRKRDDGYHDIETLFKVISLHDTLTLRQNTLNTVRISCDRPDLAVDETNICYKAARSFETLYGRAIGVDIEISKNIPIGAGLGGGSSNGAAVLVGLDRLFQLGLTAEELLEKGAQLGSDVPFFVGFLLGKGSTAFGTGRGERLDFFEWPLTEKVVIVNPNIHISTPWAYKNYSKYLPPKDAKYPSLNLTKTAKSVMFSALLKKDVFFDNDFEPLVLAEYSEIKALREMLVNENPVFSLMSGSGSTVYAMFEKERNLKNIADKFPGYFVKVCDFV
jgi:4-diphosphocytidyl-2-C-methyl-D-erythritol kinase